LKEASWSRFLTALLILGPPGCYDGSGSFEAL
jgi:hypothetical protein